MELRPIDQSDILESISLFRQKCIITSYNFIYSEHVGITPQFAYNEEKLLFFYVISIYAFVSKYSSVHTLIYI